MFAFGVGTLPSMLGMSLAAPALAAMLSDTWTRKLMGAALIILAVLSVALMVVRMQGQGGHHHAYIEPLSVQALNNPTVQLTFP